MNQAVRDAIQVRLTVSEERLAHDEAEVRDREGTLARYRARVSEQQVVVRELKEALEEDK